MPTNVQIPALGESVSEAILVKWHKADGDSVAEGDAIAELETDKANVDVPASASGVLRRVGTEGTSYRIGDTIAKIEEGAGNGKPVRTPPPVQQSSAAPEKLEARLAAASSPAAPAKSSEDVRPSVRKIAEENHLDIAKIPGTGPGGKVTKEDATKMVTAGKSPAAPASQPPARIDIRSESAVTKADAIKRVPMTKIRKRIAENLLAAQSNAAILTTFNEIDLSAVMELRSKYKERFQDIYGVGLGFMSFFARAVVQGLREFPNLNARIDGEDIVYHNYVHLGIAVSTDRGLAVPVLRNVQDLSFAKIESEIKRLADATRDGKLGLDELSGGTFTITNGGVFGSLLSTPILNPPQSGILGMHTIQKRPVAINDKVEIRPMMYVALSYDHRIVDGRESVSFLVRVKQLLEDPTRLMLEV